TCRCPYDHRDPLAAASRIHRAETPPYGAAPAGGVGRARASPAREHEAEHRRRRASPRRAREPADEAAPARSAADREEFPRSGPERPGSAGLSARGESRQQGSGADRRRRQRDQVTVTPPGKSYDVVFARWASIRESPASAGPALSTTWPSSRLSEHSGTRVAAGLTRGLDMSLSILVVERERHAREGLEAILSADGHAVKVAEDMWAGFASLFSRPYDLLLLDDNVQSERHVTLNVLDLLRFARRYEPGTSAILITSFDDEAHGYRMEEGVVAVLHKPVELSQLRVELETRSR